jgi:uracil-DNA glycosylase
MDARDELNKLIRQATEYLRYQRELGVTHIGEAFAPTIDPMHIVLADPVATEVNQSLAQETELNESPAPSSSVSEVEATTLFPPSTPSPQPVPTMTTKKEAPTTLSLFGEPDATQFEAQANESLEAIRRDVDGCQLCKLWQTRANTVFGEGSPQAELMFVGEAPGADEDATGRPFVGRAGQLLNKMLEAINLKREDIYIANVLKSRPPGNRNPEADEVKACLPFLLRQIEVIRPRLIVALGNPAMQTLLETKVGITKMRGEFKPYPRLPGIWVIPTFHPAYLLRSPDKKREAWEDLKKIRAFLRGELQP